MTNEENFIWSLVYAGVVVVVLAMFFGAVASTGLAPEPGDPLYVAWLDVTQYGKSALILTIPGIGGALYILHEKLNSGR